jgi:putative protease
MAAEFWHQQGIKRIVLARELSLIEIREFRQKTSDSLELEAFIHGAMCISYSGRCLLSNFMVGRDANRGECTHPCRWNYQLMEAKRPGEYFPIYEDDRGSYIFNSKDLCMIEHIPSLVESGINSFKLEGRSKSVFYVASVVGAYRKAIDTYYRDPSNYSFEPSWLEEVGRASHRLYTTGFYFNKPGQGEQNYETSQYVREFTFVGVIKDYDPTTGLATMEQRNKLSVNDRIQIFGPYMEPFDQTIDHLYNQEGEPTETAPHAQQIVSFKVEKPVFQNCMVCTRK